MLFVFARCIFTSLFTLIGVNILNIPTISLTLKLSNLGKAISQTANGSVVVYRTNLKNVRLGSIKLTNVSAVILPTLSKNTPVLLGMSFLKQVELIQKDNLLTLRQFK